MSREYEPSKIVQRLLTAILTPIVRVENWLAWRSILIASCFSVVMIALLWAPVLILATLGFAAKKIQRFIANLKGVDND